MTKKITELDKVIGNQLRTLRLMRGLSQVTLGGLIGVTFQQVQKYEAGVNRIAASMLHRIAVALKVQLSYFFPEVGTTLDAMPKLIPAVVRALGHMTPEQQRCVMRLAEAAR